MSLIVTSKHSRRDLEAWGRIEREAKATSATLEYSGLVDEAKGAVDGFQAIGGGYLGVSWGKDSMVVAHMTRPHDTPMVWVRIDPMANPECAIVRDRFLARFPSVYVEIPSPCRRGNGTWHATGTLERGFAMAAERFGDRHISGVRGEESSVRRLTVRRNGTLSRSTCRPLAHWRAIHVFTYMIQHELPIHPAYGYTMDGVLDPRRLRVDTLGCKFGDGMGRAEWESRYYRERLSEIRRMP